MAAPPAAGYSGKPVWQKLGLAPGMRVYVADPPQDIDAILAGAPKELTRLARLAECEFALVFVTASRQVEAAVDRIAPKLVPGGMLWFAWPKKTSGVATDVTETGCARSCFRTAGSTSRCARSTRRGRGSSSCGAEVRQAEA